MRFFKRIIRLSFCAKEWNAVIQWVPKRQKNNRGLAVSWGTPFSIKTETDFFITKMYILKFLFCITKGIKKIKLSLSVAAIIAIVKIELKLNYIVRYNWSGAQPRKALKPDWFLSISKSSKYFLIKKNFQKLSKELAKDLWALVL